MMKNALGKHVIAEFWGCERMNESEFIERTLIESALQSGATYLSSKMHDFGQGFGVTGIIVLAESHISIHSWPEHNYAAIDVFMCGQANPLLAIEYMKQEFKPTSVTVDQYPRGVLTQGALENAS